MAESSILDPLMNSGDNLCSNHGGGGGGWISRSGRGWTGFVGYCPIFNIFQDSSVLEY
jgi:hypothetical protein